MQGFFYNIEVAIFAEHGWYKQPIIGCTYPAIISYVAIKSPPCKL